MTQTHTIEIEFYDTRAEAEEAAETAIDGREVTWLYIAEVRKQGMSRLCRVPSHERRWMVVIYA